MSKALELIELGHGLLRDLPDCRLWGVDDGVPQREIRKRLGMEAEEVIRLLNRSEMPAQAGGGSFSASWKPGKG
ncbi:hypothetical protein LBMAG41_10730 [Cyanobium sp.]|nr:hypothetical protein LBMAG41_10730 [Cyanobium sp.]